MSLPQTDVIIPAFNAGGTVGEAIASVLSQTVPDLRVIVIDDGSTDDTVAVVNAFSARDERVLLISQANRGIVSALNAGLAVCRAPFVARLDADDLSEPDRHEKQLRHFAAHADVVAVSGAHREIRADGSPTGHVHAPAQPLLTDPAWAPAKEPQLTQPFFMVRRAVLEKAGGFRPLLVSEDSDLYWRLAEHGRLDNLPDILGSYRMHAGSISSASVVNGRLMALCSQLAALSAQRRRAGEADLVFDAKAGAGWRGAQAAGKMLARAISDLDLRGDEAVWLRVAMAAKLMELAGYRPYELETEDCHFIADALADVPDLPEGNREDLARMQAATAARLLRMGRLTDARAVAPRTLWPQALVRAVTNRTYWKKHLA